MNQFSSDVPPDVITFTITVYNKGKRSKDNEVAELTVELSNLTNGDEVCMMNYIKKNIFINLKCYPFKFFNYIHFFIKVNFFVLINTFF